MPVLLSTARRISVSATTRPLTAASRSVLATAAPDVVRAHESERYAPVSRSVAAQHCASKSKVNELRSGSADEQHSCLCACVTAPCAPPYAASARDSWPARSHYDARCYALLYWSAAQCWDALCELILAARCSQRDELLPELVPSDQRVSQLPDCAALRTFSGLDSVRHRPASFG